MLISQVYFLRFSFIQVFRHFSRHLIGFLFGIGFECRNCWKLPIDWFVAWNLEWIQLFVSHLRQNTDIYGNYSIIVLRNMYRYRYFHVDFLLSFVPPHAFHCIFLYGPTRALITDRPNPFKFANLFVSFQAPHICFFLLLVFEMTYEK